MEQLKDIILSFEAFAEGRDGSVSPFSLQVSSPEFDEDRGYFCRVHCPYLREKPFLIFGIDEAQACELSRDFIRQMLANEARLVDTDGNEIPMPEIAPPRS